jgi:hypothetical protein
MALTADQIANTTATEFDVKLRYFAAAAYYNTLTLAHYEFGSAPVGWTISGDSITPAGTWVEVTDSVYARGSLTYEWVGSALRWSTELQGENYDEDYFAVDRAVMCLRRIVRGAYDSGWVVWWIGCIAAGAWRDDYRLGAQWQRSVRGTDVTLRLTDAPRLTAGRINIAEDASATASTTLATPSVEAANGEFVGSTANVGAGNVVDQRLNTVWISQSPPSSTSEVVVGDHSSGLMIDEVFFKPIAGLDPDKCWWFEVVNTKTDTQEVTNPAGWWLAYSSTGQAVACWISPGIELQPGQRVVICGNRAAFEAMTGGAKGAQRVYATDELSCYVCTGFTSRVTREPYLSYNINLTRTAWVRMTLNATGGYVLKVPGDFNGFGDGINGLDCVKWGTDRALPTGLDATEVATYLWNGATVDISTIIDGQSIRRVPTGGGVGGSAQDSHTAGDWQIETYPTPGDKYSVNRFDWLLLTLPEHVSTLGTNITTASTTIEIDEGTLGWPVAGDGVIEGDTFSYTGRTDTELTGVTGLASSHTAGAKLNPYVGGVAQTGWSITSVRLRRRPGTAYILRYEVWVSESASPTTPDGEDPSNVLWRADYDEPHYTGANLNGYTGLGGGPDLTVYLAPDTGARWARCILINILEMYPETGEVTGARAKLNEVEINLDEMTLPDQGVTSLPGVTAGLLAEYLIDQYTWLQLSDFSDLALTWGEIGAVATAIQPLPSVLEDLARMHGCIVGWGVDGQITWLPDPWWPGGITKHPDCADGPIYRWEPSTVRGEITFQTAQTEVSGVAVTAMDGEGNPLERVTAPPGITGSGVREFTGLTVANQDTARRLAYKLELKEKNQDRCTLTVKGIGEWCWPTQVYYVEWPDGTERGTWIAERVTWSWAFGAAKQWSCTLDLRRMYVG